MDQKVNSTENIPIVRRPNIDYQSILDGGDFNKFFYDDNPVITHFWANFSILATPIEAFFIRNVNELKGEINDPLLRKRVDNFVRQEANHSAEHNQANKVLQQLDYPVKENQAMLSRALDKIKGSQLQLAVTMTGEFFLGELGHMMLEEGYAEKMDEPMRSIARWHAYEEFEHHSVTIDMYYDMYGKNLKSYLARMKSLLVIIFILGPPSGLALRRLLRVDHPWYSLRVPWELIKFNFIRPAFAFRFARKVIPFLSWNYHPKKSKDIDYYLEKYQHLMKDEWRVDDKQGSIDTMLAKEGF